MDNWQPIATAPKDGTEILGWRKDTGKLLVRWDCPANFMTDQECEIIGMSSEEYDWFYADFIEGGRLEESPTHWMPMPDDPTPEKELITILSLDGKSVAIGTPTERQCNKLGCPGTVYQAVWTDGTITYPCRSGMTFRDEHVYQIC